MTSISSDVWQPTENGTLHFNLFQFISEVPLGNRASVLHDDGEEVSSFQFTITSENESGEISIDYTYQVEDHYFHDVCNGVMCIDSLRQTVNTYTLHDKYDNWFEPHPDRMFENFNNADPECINFYVLPVTRDDSTDCDDVQRQCWQSGA